MAADFAPAMVSLCAQKVRRAGLTPRVLPTVADALSLPFDDQTFDAVTLTFGVRNLASPRRGLTEAWRVLRPEGLLGLLEFLRPEPGLGSTVGTFYRRRLLPVLASLLGGDRSAYTYLPSTIDRFLSRVEMSGLLEDLGFQVLEVTPQTLGIVTRVVARRT